MKKIISLLLSVTMLVILSIPALATDSAQEGTLRAAPTNRITVNEYEALKELAEQSAEKLITKGYSSTEIHAIKNYQETYRNHIGTLQSLSDTALFQNGYSKMQIATIRNFSGTEAEMASLGAELTLYSTPTSFNYVSGGRTTGRLAYNWYWTGVPAVKMRDMVAAVWNNWYVTGNSSYVNYYNIYSGTLYDTDSAEFRYPVDDTLVSGAGHRFYMTISDNYYWAKSGGGTFDLESDGLYQKDFSYYLEYGHASYSLNIDFTVSIPGGGSGSVSWEVAATKADYNQGNMRW